MISEKEYSEALNVINSYKQQVNKQFVNDGLISQDNFYKIQEIKHRTELTCDDIIVLMIDDNADDVKFFEKVICTGYCGRDEFWGETENGKKRSWCDNSNFKIISKRIKL